MGDDLVVENTFPSNRSVTKWGAVWLGMMTNWIKTDDPEGMMTMANNEATTLW
jgi:hypothetical protein